MPQKGTNMSQGKNCSAVRNKQGNCNFLKTFQQRNHFGSDSQITVDVGLIKKDSCRTGRCAVAWCFQRHLESVHSSGSHVSTRVSIMWASEAPFQICSRHRNVTFQEVHIAFATEMLSSPTTVSWIWNFELAFFECMQTCTLPDPNFWGSFRLNSFLLLHGYQQEPTEQCLCIKFWIVVVLQLPWHCFLLLTSRSPSERDPDLNGFLFVRVKKNLHSEFRAEIRHMSISVYTHPTFCMI